MAKGREGLTRMPPSIPGDMWQQTGRPYIIHLPCGMPHGNENQGKKGVIQEKLGDMWQIGIGAMCQTITHGNQSLVSRGMPCGREGRAIEDATWHLGMTRVI